MHCTNCGTELITKEVINEGMVPYCKNCEVFHFHKSNIAMISAVRNSDKEVLLLKQNKISKYYVLVAGYHKKGESLEQTVIREVKEETNLDVADVKYLGSYFYDKKDTIMVAYTAYSKTKQFSLDKQEVDDAIWKSLEEAISLVREGSIAQQVLISLR